MASNNDNAGKGRFGPGADAGPKKPTPIIDAKATRVDVKDLTPSAPPAGASPTSQPTEAGAASKAFEGKTPAAAPAGGKPAPAASGSPTGAPTGAAPDKKTDTKTGSPSAAADARPQPAPRAVRSGGGVWSTITHLAAGLIGGGIVLYGGDQLAPMIGLPAPGQPSPAAADLAQRLSALEQSTTRRPAQPDDLAQRLNATRDEIGRLSVAVSSTRSLAEQQTALAGEIKALKAELSRISSGPAGAAALPGAATERIARLESTLATLAAAAKQDPQSGGVAQLAAVTGRLADLESTVSNQLAALRKSVSQEVDSRLGQSTEASEAARAGTQRIDRELAAVKTDQTRFDQRLAELKSTDERTGKAVQALTEADTRIASSIEAVKSGLEKLARPSDIARAITPIADRVAGLEKNVSDVVKSEADRRANAERIVMALELGNLKRTVERGVPYAAQLREVRSIAGSKLDLSALDRYKDKGVPTAVELANEFRTLAHRIIDADTQPADGSWSDRLLAGAKSIVKVRKTDAGANEQGVEAVVARMEKGLKEGRLVDVLGEAGKLSAKAQKPAGEWLEKVGASASVARAIDRIENELKSSLGGASNGKKG